MEVLVDHLGEVQFEITARNHKIISDQPTGSGGYDGGMTPPELMLASLGACAGYYAAQYLRTRGLSVAGIRIRVTAEKAKAPARLADFGIRVELPAPLDEHHTAGLLRAVESCLIRNTLLTLPAIHTEIAALVTA